MFLGYTPKRGAFDSGYKGLRNSNEWIAGHTLSFITQPVLQPCAT